MATVNVMPESLPFLLHPLAILVFSFDSYISSSEASLSNYVFYALWPGEAIQDCTQLIMQPLILERCLYNKLHHNEPTVTVGGLSSLLSCRNGNKP